MSLNWKELENQVSCVAPRIVGGVVQKIVQAGSFAAGEAFVLHGFSYDSGAWHMLVSMRGNTAFFGLLPRGIQIDHAKEPCTFIMVLRKHFLGPRISELEQIPGERILRLGFEHGKSLLIETIPRRANLLAVEDWNEREKSGKCLASFRKVSLGAGGRYSLPESKIFEVKEQRDFAEAPGKDLNERIVNHFYSSLAADSFEVERHAWLQSLKAAQKKIQVALAKVEQESVKVEKADRLKEQAMVLSERLFELGPKKTPYEKKIELERFADGKRILVSLDTNFSYAENAEKLFKQVKKLSRAEEEVFSRLTELRAKQDNLEALAAAVDSAADEGALRLIGPRLLKAGVNAPKVKTASEKKPKIQEAKEYLEAESSDGFTILCGRNQNENRAVTFHGASGSDIWMHLKGVPGAHVVIKAKKNKTVPLATLLEAAQITLYYSKVRDGKKADVDYTYRKNVKPIKGTLAEVTYTDNKTIYVEADGEVVRRVLRQSGE